MGPQGLACAECPVQVPGLQECCSLVWSPIPGHLSPPLLDNRNGWASPSERKHPLVSRKCLLSWLPAERDTRGTGTPEGLMGGINVRGNPWRRANDRKSNTRHICRHASPSLCKAAGRWLGEPWVEILPSVCPGALTSPNLHYFICKMGRVTTFIMGLEVRFKDSRCVGPLQLPG